MKEYKAAENPSSIISEHLSAISGVRPTSLAHQRTAVGRFPSITQSFAQDAITAGSRPKVMQINTPLASTLNILPKFALCFSKENIDFY